MTEARSTPVGVAVAWCSWPLRPSGCGRPGVLDVWARDPQGVDRRHVCATHLTVATALGYQQGEPPRGEAVGG